MDGPYENAYDHKRGVNVVRDKDSGERVFLGSFSVCRDLAYILNGARLMQAEDDRLAKEAEAAKLVQEQPEPRFVTEVSDR
jgi:hypothetical protein